MWNAKGFYTCVKISTAILGDYDIVFVHNFTYQLEMPTLVVSHRIIIHHEEINEEINLTCLYNYHKIKNENIPSMNKFDKGIDGSKQNKTMWRSLKKPRFNLAWATKGLSYKIFMINCFCFVTKWALQRLQHWYPTGLGIFQNINFSHFHNIKEPSEFQMSLLGELEK